MGGFDWDEGNKTKNWVGHRVTVKECEEIFFNRPTVEYKDVKHSIKENRFGILGKTDKGRRLHVIFTVRTGNIRVISVRDQNKKERRYYESKNK